MTAMLLVLNVLLYGVALGLALAVLTPLPERPSRRLRVARLVLIAGGGLAMGSAITLSFLGLWLASGVAGCIALVVVATCLWVGISARARPGDDDDGGDGGGGGPPKHPEPPLPTRPAGDGDDERWSEFDRARAGWERPRDPVGA